MNKFVILAFFALAVGALADYAKPAYHAPAPAPAYHAPEKHHHGYAAPAHHAPVVHTYPVHAPHVKCGANLLVGCAPSAAHAPCVPSHGHGHGYGHGHGHGHGHAAPHYRAPESDSFDQFEE